MVSALEKRARRASRAAPLAAKPDRAAHIAMAV